MQSEFLSRFGLSYMGKLTYLYRVNEVNKEDLFYSFENDGNKNSGVEYKKTPHFLLVLTQLIITVDANKSSNYDYFGSNLFLSDKVYAHTGIRLSTSDIKRALNHLAKDGFISMSYNPLITAPGQHNRYQDLSHGDYIREGVYADCEQPRYRIIKLNVDLIMEACGVVELSHPLYVNANARSRLRKFIKGRVFYKLDLVKKDFKRIQKALKETDKFIRANLDVKVASSVAAVVLFMKNVSSKYLDIKSNTLLQYSIYANKFKDKVERNTDQYYDRDGFKSLPPSTQEMIKAFV